MKRCYALRHVPFESLGLLEPLLLARGFAIEVVDVPTTALDPVAFVQAELVIVLGGPVSVYEERLYPWLLNELDIVEARLRGDRPTLGICLGAQLIARALGAKVYPGARKELGWAPLLLNESGRQGALGAVEHRSVLHWHGDTFDLPQGSTLLASTEATPHQAFTWRRAAVALQFHLEVTLPELEAWYVGHAVELSRCAEFSITELRAAGQRFAAELEPHAKRALAGLLDGLVN